MWGAVAGLAGKAWEKLKPHLPGIAQTGMSYLGEREKRGWQSSEAQKNRDFQERMSSTSWQRGVKDMEAAGLNPALAYSQGGASSPGGSMATGAENTAHSAIALKNMRATVAAQEAQVKKLGEEASNLRATRDGIQVDNALKLLAVERARFEAQNYRAAGATIGTALDGLGMIPRGARMLGYEGGRLGIRQNPGVRLSRWGINQLRNYYNRVDSVADSLGDSLSNWWQNSNTKGWLERNR